MARVCDKCQKKFTGKPQVINLGGTDYEICDECASKVVRWLTEPLKLGILGGLFKK